MNRKVVGRWLGVAVLCWCLPTGSRGQDLPVSGRSAVAQDQIRLMRYFDTNRDRRIDADEFSVGLDTAALVLMLSWRDSDQSGDGFISFEELGPAVVQAWQALMQPEEEEYDAQVAEALASAVPLNVVLDGLAVQVEFAAEIADLRHALKDFDNGEVVVTYILRYPKRYPHLTPVIRTWGWYYPVKPALRRHFGKLPDRRPWYVKPPGARKTTGKTGVGPAPKPKTGGKAKTGGKTKKPPKPSPKP